MFRHFYNLCALFLHFANARTISVIEIALQINNKRLKLLEIRANEIVILFCKIFARGATEGAESVAMKRIEFRHGANISKQIS